MHRYFLYAALLFLIVLGYDVWKALWFTDAGGRASRSASASARWSLLTNVVLLSGYTFGCHSLRHLVAGKRDEMSRRVACDRVPMRHVLQPAAHGCGPGAA